MGPYESVCNPLPNCADNEMLVYDLATNTKHCITNVCICPNGKAVDYCTEHKSYQCASCNDGFVLKNGFCVACPPFQHVEINALTGESVCAPNVCGCENGEASSDCPADGLHFCESCYEGFESIGNTCVAVKVVTSCDPGFTLEDGKCLVEKDVTYALLPSFTAKAPSAIELSNGGCLGLVDNTVQDGFGELRPLPCDHENVVGDFYYNSKKKVIIGKKNSSGFFKKSQACIIQKYDDNYNVRLYTVKCGGNEWPENSDFNKKKGNQKLGLLNELRYLTPSKDDTKNFLELPYWDPVDENYNKTVNYEIDYVVDDYEGFSIDS